ncbi:predicted protein [Verticillium alfalfae VaMs.102]|uniref:Predicted protein n=1 Tax=Verticillium alfalfae (strain VaMs.102 / ATCC MYA-4576 / FGSC 10136) TaxID=526221 RepID=C9SQL9_VERA1|nr:predicted protein [Verticillium alfalfae VaMs.102]EEY21144.1 predicted protein [Verticillium alfalfae VaMs.102]
MNPIQSAPTVTPAAVQQFQRQKAKRRPQETDSERQSPLEPLPCHSSPCREERRVSDLANRPQFVFAILTLMQNLQQQKQQQQQQQQIHAQRRSHALVSEASERFHQLRQQWTEHALNTCLGTSNLVLDPVELIGSTKGERKPYTDMQNYQQSQDVLENHDIMLPHNETDDGAFDTSTGTMTGEHISQIQPDDTKPVSTRDNESDVFSGPESIERLRLNQQSGNLLPLPLVVAMAKIVATYAGYCSMTANVVSILAVMNGKDNCFSKQMNVADGSSNNYFYEVDDNTATMDGHGAWAASGAGLPVHDFLHGMSAFESPLSEILEGDFSDDIEFDAFIEKELAKGYGLEVFPSNGNTGDPCAFDFNTPVVPTPDFNDPLLFPIVDDSQALGYSSFDFNLPAAESFFAPLSIGDASPYTNSPFTHSTNSASPFTTSPDSTTESDTSGHAYACTADSCFKTFKKESQLKQHQRVHKKSLTCPHCPSAPKFAQVRDLERHLQVRHKDVAARDNVRSETRQCPFEGCAHRGRRDNVSRHFESKHGGKLMWRKGVPTVLTV